MTIKSTSVDQYKEMAPKKCKKPITKLRLIIKENLPSGFIEIISFSMIGYAVPKSIYPNGYHTKKDEPLPFITIAVQKNYISIYHLGIYAKKELYTWLVDSYTKIKGKKLDIRKSCMRFKNEKDIPYDLIKELVNKITVDEWMKKDI